MAALDDADMPLNTRAALVRTRLAFERTLMAWVRTAVSLITFGFTLFKAFQWAGQHAPAPDDALLSPRALALAMIALGIVALLMASGQHVLHVRRLRQELGALPVISVGILVALAFIVIGVLALLTVIRES